MSNKFFEFSIGQGNRLPAVVGVVSGISSLAGATAQWVYWLVDGTGLVYRKTASIVGDGSSNQVRYDWAVGDTDIAGTYYGRFDITTVDGKKVSAPNTDVPLRFEIFPMT